MSKTYVTYRDGKGDLRSLLQAALADFYRRYGGALPVEVVVPRSQVGAAKAAMVVLDLPRLAVRSTGGCLAGEVWLALPAESDR